MAEFVSKLYPGERVILDGDTSTDWQAVPPDCSKGYEAPSEVERQAVEGFSNPFNIPLIPRSEWRERIEQRERDKSRLSDLGTFDSKDQNGTNYCWFHGVVTAMLFTRARMNVPYIHLSASSGAAIIKGYRNVGGWGGQAIQFAVERGVASVETWPENKIDRQFDNAESQAERQRYKIRDWYQLPRSFDAYMTALVCDMACPAAYNWWGHLVCGIDPIALPNGKFGSRLRNSWGNRYGTQGFFILEEGKGTPADAQAIHSVTAT